VSDFAWAIGRSGPDWLGVEWTGRVQHAHNANMTVTTAKRTTEVEYPGEPLGSTTFTNLCYNSTLVAGETDIARFMIDASNLEPGQYEVKVRLTYDLGSKNESTRETLPFTVK